jgi:hypothetical protein
VPGSWQATGLWLVPGRGKQQGGDKCQCHGKQQGCGKCQGHGK